MRSQITGRGWSLARCAARGSKAYLPPTPPLEALRSVLSLAATDLEGRAQHIRLENSEGRTQISVIDIKRAFFNARTAEESPTYVELPPEDPDSKRGLCGRLLVHMYGTRAAGDGWHSEYSEFLMNELGFVRGDASPCLFPSSTLFPSPLLRR